MTDTLVDTNVLLDIGKQDPRWVEWSARNMADAGDNGSLVVNQVVYAELAAGYGTIEALDAALQPERFRRESVPWDAAYAAGLAFLAYRRRGGGRSSPLPDFFIGAHAAVRGYNLLTRDRGYYRAYFPTLNVVSPETAP
jgi:predicted nucleic acid-binding protein